MEELAVEVRKVRCITVAVDDQLSFCGEIVGAGGLQRVLAGTASVGKLVSWHLYTLSSMFLYNAQYSCTILKSTYCMRNYTRSQGSNYFRSYRLDTHG